MAANTEATETSQNPVQTDPRATMVAAVPKEKSTVVDPDSERIVETKGTARLNSAILVLIGFAIGIVFSSLVVSVMWGTIFQNALHAIG